MESQKIGVLIVDDSPINQKLLAHLCTSDPELFVVGIAGNGEEALAFVSRRRPDVILMDIVMPVMNGYEATRRIMETDPIPIVICSASTQPGEVDKTFQALDAGAAGFVKKPVGPGHPDFQADVVLLKQTLKTLSRVRLAKRSSGTTEWSSMSREVMPPSLMKGRPRLVAIGASTGGPVALQLILKHLPRNFPLPLLIVQHIAPGFIQGMADWLQGSTGFLVRIAVGGIKMEAGQGYLAPDGCQMGINGKGEIVLRDDPPENGLRPAVSYLFRSVAEALGACSVGIILSGMGKDGAEDLKVLRDKGALTIAQDEESSMIHGMPGEAIRLGAAGHVLSPERISNLLARLVE